jgi:hypothetical protein
MAPLPPPLAFFLLFSGWVNRQQQAVIDYLLEENRGLRAAQTSRRLRLTDDQRRRLAVFASRTLGKQPGFSAVATLTLALGIGATTAIFSVAYGVLLKPLPFDEPDRLVADYHQAPGF